MSPSLPNAKSSPSPDSVREREKLRRLIVERGLCGLANDTKWNELIEAMRDRVGWRPSYRFKCIDGVASHWDAEWFYHLPFPFIAIEWIDLRFLQESTEHHLPPRVHATDHSPWLEELLNQIGLEYQKGRTMIRLFGYSPKNLDLFDGTA